MKVKEKKSPKEQLINEFLGKINPTGWRTNRKAALSELEYSILNNGEQIEFPETNLVKMLLAGSKHHPKGLLRICGEHSVSKMMTPALTRAAIIALKLVAKLLDPSIYSGAKHFLENLKVVPVSCLAHCNFAHHLVRDNALEAGTELFDSAMHVITAFLVHTPSLQLSDFIPDDWARYFYLRQAVGYYTQNPSNKYWEECVYATNFSHSMITEFLSTSKHRMSRDLWLKSITTYLLKCRPVLRDDTIETLLGGSSKSTRGLLHMCNKKNSYSPAARELLAQLIDENLYPDARRIIEFLLVKRKKLLGQLTLPQIFEKSLATADDEKIYAILSKSGKGELKEALSTITETHEEDDDETTKTETQDLDLDDEPTPLGESRARSDTSLDTLRKTYGKMQRCPSSDISWGDFNTLGSSWPSVLSVLDDSLFQSPIASPLPLRPPSPTSSEDPPPTSLDPPSSPRDLPSPTPASPSRMSSSPLSVSPISSGRASEEYPEVSGISNPASPRSAPMSDDEAPRKSYADMENQVIAVLTAFFEAHGPSFTRIDYRRLLIFLLSLVASRAGKVDVDSIFLELGLDTNPQFEISAARLFEELDRIDANFTDELSNRWASCIMREIAATEKNLDP